MDLRNICIIAHVDHGKTTLVDHLLKQAGTFHSHQHVAERMMDSMDLERERGITIRAKNAAFLLGQTKVNIVDTPGHSDFGGEVERILGMVDGSVLLVDGAEGPLPQTRFVLQKSLKKGHRVILVINKVDRPECQDLGQIDKVIDQTLNLFVDLGASNDQADFPILYACARDGWATPERNEITDLVSGTKKGSLQPLFETILQYLVPPRTNDIGALQMLISNIGWSDYVGRLAIGRITSGQIRRGEKTLRLGVNARGEPLRDPVVVSRIYTYKGLEQIEADCLDAGDIAVVAGSDLFSIGDTLVGSDAIPALPRIQVEEPTLAMVFSINTSPLAGKEGEAIQSRKLRERLLREVRQNVAMRMEETAQPDQFRVLGRGELQFAILIEQMRREGSECMVGKPIVLTKTSDSGGVLEPMEIATLDLPKEHSGDATRMFQERKGILRSFEPDHSGKRVRLEFEIPTRGLLGMRSSYLTATRGEGLFATHLLGFAPWKGDFLHRVNGALVCDREGVVMEYALLNLEDRGQLFVQPGTTVYQGMIVGEHNKDTDLNINPCREKKLTNIRAAHAEVLVKLKGIYDMSLEKCIEWIDEDEWIEITPKSVRLRKKILEANLRSVKRG